MKEELKQTEAYEAPKAEMIDFILEGGIFQDTGSNQEPFIPGPNI